MIFSFEDSGRIPPTAFFYYVSPDLYFIMNSGNNILVMCDAYTPAGNPIPTNKRYNAAKIFSNSKVVSEEPWYGIEEEYTLMQKGGPYYCGVGADKAIGRDIMDAHYKACLYAGIGISGVNGEVTLGQWEFQVGPVEGISTGDQVWVARYLLELRPKTSPGWNNGGLAVIKNTIEKLQVKHKENIAAYGEGNECRLTGKHETAYINMFSWGVANRGASVKHKENIAAYGEGNERRLTGKRETTYINTFSWGVATRGASVRVGRDTEKEGKGYFEDRRPASNMDPYVVTSMIAETTILG
uniref:glutamine synthetase n=1 Tax=Brassica oleracea var. oleracea TaxID=109376 RepID=A0A0D3DXK2_BRAOL